MFYEVRIYEISCTCFGYYICFDIVFLQSCVRHPRVRVRRVRNCSHGKSGLFTLFHIGLFGKLQIYLLYDEYGNEIRATKEDPNGELLATWLSEYDENNNLIKKTVDTGDGTPFVQLIQNYDANGNLIERHEFSQNGETVFTYQYDGQNRLVSKSCGGQIIETYTYEADGSYRAQTVYRENEYRLYNRDGKITERHFGTASKWVYSYNADGVLVEFTSYSGNDIKEKQIRQLDEHGNVIKIIKQSSSGTETVLGENEYKLYTVKVR